MLKTCKREKNIPIKI